MCVPNYFMSMYKHTKEARARYSKREAMPGLSFFLHLQKSPTYSIRKLLGPQYSISSSCVFTHKKLLKSRLCALQTKLSIMTEPEIGTGKTVFVIAVVLGCFAVLYPKIFYHMMFDEKKDKPQPENMRPGPHEFGRPPMHRGHPAMHMRNEQGKLFYGEEGQQVRRTVDKELKPGPVPGMRPTMGGPGLPQIPRGNQVSIFRFELTGSTTFFNAFHKNQQQE